MNLDAPKGYSTPTTALGAGPPSLKALLGLMGIFMLWLLIALGVVPSFRLSTVLLTIASASFMVVKGRGIPDLLHPVRIFGALWCFCLALASMRLLPVISDWDYLMWSCVLTALVSFIGGFWLARRFWDRRAAGLRLASADLVPAKSLMPNRKTLIAAALCLAAGMGVLAYEYSLIGEIPVLSDNMDAARMKLFGVAGQVSNPEFGTLHVKILHPFVEFNKYGIFLALIVLFQKKRKSRKVIFLSLVFILLGTLAYGSQGARTFVVDIAITGTVLFHYLRRRVRLVELGAAFLILFLFVGLFGSYRIKESESAPLFERGLSTSSFPEGAFWDGIAFGYASVTSSFEVFYRLTEDLRTAQRPSQGFLFYALHRFIPRTNIQEFDFDLYGGELITPTFLGEFYADYGYWAVLFGPLVLGLIYGWAYSRGGDQNAVYWVYVRALLLKMLIFFPYGNLFSQYVTWILDLFFMYLLIRHLGAPAVHPLPHLAVQRPRDPLPV